MPKIQPPSNPLCRAADCAADVVSAARLVTLFLSEEALNNPHDEAGPLIDDARQGRVFVLRMVADALGHAEALIMADRKPVLQVAS